MQGNAFAEHARYTCNRAGAGTHTWRASLQFSRDYVRFPGLQDAGCRNFLWSRYCGRARGLSVHFKRSRVRFYKSFA